MDGLAASDLQEEFVVPMIEHGNGGGSSLAFGRRFVVSNNGQIVLMILLRFTLKHALGNDFSFHTFNTPLQTLQLHNSHTHTRNN